tara:strand:- start:110 stop:388 length:279 start_codon:yes stop_codon:yes gene_type:complete
LLKTSTFFQSDSAGGGIKKGGHVTRSLPDKPKLKHEAKRILSAVKTGAADEFALLRLVEKHTESTEKKIQLSVTLLDVQLALARDYGYSGWP